MQQKSASIPGERLAGISEARGRRQTEPIACLMQRGRVGVDEPRKLHAIAKRLPDVANPARAHVPAPSIRQRYRSLMTASSQADHAEYRETERVLSRLVPPVPWIAARRDSASASSRNLQCVGMTRRRLSAIGSRLLPDFTTHDLRLPTALNHSSSRSGVEVLVPPRRLVAIDAFPEMTFPLHAELFHDAPGRGVLRLAGRDHAVDLTATRSRIAAVPPQPRSRIPAGDSVGERPSRARRCGGRTRDETPRAR